MLLVLLVPKQIETFEKGFLCFCGLVFGRCLTEECFVGFVILGVNNTITGEKKLWGSSFNGYHSFCFLIYAFIYDFFSYS